MLPPQPLKRPAAPARQLLWWLVLAMLLAPALGRIHQLLHPPAWQAAVPGQVHVHAGAAAHAGTSHGAPGPWLLALFVGHSHSDCQLHDQLNAWASPPAAGEPLPAAFALQLPRPVVQRAAIAGSAAFFDPRAPPAAEA